MIANSAFFAAMLLMVLVFLEMRGLEVLIPYKRLIFPRYLWGIVGTAVLIYLNLFAAVYLLARALFLKETGRKLAHVEKQLRTSDAVVRDLADRLREDE